MRSTRRLLGGRTLPTKWGAPHVRAPQAGNSCPEHPGSYHGWRSSCPNVRRSSPDPSQRKPVEGLFVARRLTIPEVPKIGREVAQMPSAAMLSGLAGSVFGLSGVRCPA